ncbi:MAG TPA: hypothetical protein P5087_03970 [Eubacteriales bacterium]|nr:hypothetical protein [Eubacteriales bacterium]
MNKLAKIRKIVAVTVAILFLIAAPIFIIPRLTQKKSQSVTTKQGIIELWHIETFEGGSASRMDWLKARALEYEKLHKGIYVHVTLLTVEQAVNMAESRKVDLISFAAGAGTNILSFLDTYKGAVNSIDVFANGGVFCAKQYAVPYMTGGYFLFSKNEINLTEIENQEILFGFGAYNSPLTAFSLTVAKAKISADYSVTQYKAYERFLSEKNAVLIGTQRDEYRLGNRVDSGSLQNIYAVPLTGFTDLTQYLGISRSCADVDTATDFVEYLTCDTVQAKLYRCNMFSVCGIKVYQNGFMADMEKSLNKIKILNVFSSELTIEKLKEASENAANGIEKGEILYFLSG